MLSFLCQQRPGVGQARTEEGVFHDFNCWSQPWWPCLQLPSWISAVPSLGGNPRITWKVEAKMDPGQGQTGKNVWKTGSDLGAPPLGEERECDPAP